VQYRPNSPVQILIHLLVIVALMGGNYLYVNWFVKKAEPAAKMATETRLGVGIERFWSGSWTVPAKNLENYQGSKLLLRIEVFVIHSVLWILFVAGFLLEIALFYLFFAWLYRGSR
jgi:hypothetical protein